MFGKLIRVRIGSRKVFLRMPFGGAVYDEDSGKLYYLNEDGAKVFEAVCGDFFKALDSLCSGEDRRECIQRIVEFLREASARGHVVVYSPLSLKKPGEGRCFKLDWIVPSLIDIKVTRRCNASCPYCYLARTSVDMDINSLRKFLDDLTHVEDLTIRVSFVLLSGGEPLIHPQFEEVLELTLHYASKVGILTNGIGLDNYLDVLTKHRDRVLIQVSIDSIDEELYAGLKGVEPKTLKRVLVAVREAIERDLTIYIAIPVSKRNIEDVPQTAKELKKMFGDRVKLRIAPVISVGEADERYAIRPEDLSLLSKIREYSEQFGDPLEIEAAKKMVSESPIGNCGAGWLRIYIDAEGYVKPCPISPDSTRLGHISEGVAKVLGSAKTITFAEMNPPNAEGICRGCPYASWCHRCFARAMWIAMKGVECRWMLVEGRKVAR